MTIRRMIAEMHRQLAGQYPVEEIESFARILFRHYLAMTPAQMHLSQDCEPAAGTEKQIRRAIDELKTFRPIQYILGETEFYGLTFGLTPAVLIPRPETEELVDWIVREHDGSAVLSIADVGTGSGCIAVALAVRFPNAELWAVDNSGEALDVARRNARRNGVHVHFLRNDVLKDGMQGFEPGSLDVIVSNPPYIEPSAKQKMHPNVLEYEPHGALFAPADDPLIFYGQIAASGSKYLKDRGRIFFEINEAFPEETVYILERNGYSDITPRRDINGKWRMIAARKQGSAPCARLGFK